MNHLGKLSERSNATRRAEHGRDSVVVLHIACVVTAIALVLPAIGMIEAGFTSGERSIGLLGLALMFGLGIGYYLVLRLIFKSSPE